MGKKTKKQEKKDLNESPNSQSGESEPKKSIFERHFPDNYEGLTKQEAAERLVEYGRNELPEKTTPCWLIYIKGLWGPMPIALWIAVIAEFGLENWPDGGILLFIQFANATIGWYETIKAGNAVAALKSSLKPKATVCRDRVWMDIDATEVVPGDKVKLASGSAIPADCTINDDPEALVMCEIEVDEAALTGESLPVTLVPESEHMAKMGSTVVRGEVDATVQLTGGLTTLGRAASLLASVKTDLGNIHHILVKVMYGLTGLSALLCTACFLWLMLYHHTNVRIAISFTVVLLVVSIPIAIEIVVTTTLALGSKQLSKKKVIVTRLSSIEMMAGVNMLCSDKTGTLTQNKMSIQEFCPLFEAEDREHVLMLAALAAKWREPPRDALDTMVLRSADLDRCDAYKQIDYKPFDPRVKRTEATLVDENGLEFIVTKGAPNIVVQLCVNRQEIEERVDGIINELAGRGIRCLAVAATNAQGEWRMAGILTFLDPPRPDTKATVANAIRFGVDVKMVTGDHSLIAKEMCRMLGMDPNIETSEDLPQFPESGNPKDIPDTLGEDFGPMIEKMGGFAQVHPEHKYLIVETLRQRGYVCAMTGDGVNDAPALKRADVGVAVEGSTDAARAAADMVLTEPGLSVIVDAMLIARGVFQRMLSFLTYRISATLQLVFFFFIALFTFNLKDYKIDDPKYPDVTEFFHLPVLMFMLITLLNDGTLLTIGYDRAVPQPRPQRWNLPVLFLVGAVLAAVACVSSLLLLWMALQSHDSYHGSVYEWLGLPETDFPHLITTIYLKVSISDFLTLFSSRTQNRPFFAFRPSLVLLIGAFLSLLISTVLATFWPESHLDKIHVVGLGYGDLAFQKFMPAFVWFYCLAWWFLQDAAKVLTYYVMDKTDLLSYRSAQDPSHNVKRRRKKDTKQDNESDEAIDRDINMNEEEQESITTSSSSPPPLATAVPVVEPFFSSSSSSSSSSPPPLATAVPVVEPFFSSSSSSSSSQRNVEYGMEGAVKGFTTSSSESSPKSMPSHVETRLSHRYGFNQT